MDCDCRKPKPGLLLRAAKEYHIDLSESWMIGDGENDILAGQNAGCRTGLITNAAPGLSDGADLTGGSLLEVVDRILAH